jgi:hypothetical protein
MGSPTSPLTPYQNSPGSGEETEEPTSPALEGSPTAEHAIDLGRIRRGEDVRTTVRFYSSFTMQTANSSFQRS